METKMITATEYEQAINAFKAEGKLDESFKMYQYMNGCAVGMDNKHNVIFWSRIGFAVSMSTSLHIASPQFNEETQMVELVDSLGVLEQQPQLNIAELEYPERKITPDRTTCF